MSDGIAQHLDGIDFQLSQLKKLQSETNDNLQGIANAICDIPPTYVDVIEKKLETLDETLKDVHNVLCAMPSEEGQQEICDALKDIGDILYVSLISSREPVLEKQYKERKRERDTIIVIDNGEEEQKKLKLDS